MTHSQPSPLPSQAFNDVLAKLMQAKMNEGGPPPAPPCDTPAGTRTKSVMPEEAAQATWSEPTADLWAKQKAARDQLDAVTRSTGVVWKHLRNGARHAWDGLEQAVRKVRSRS